MGGLDLLLLIFVHNLEIGIDDVGFLFRLLASAFRVRGILRLAFGRSTVEEIEIGTKKLCGVISAAVSNPALLSDGPQDFEELYV